MPEPVLLSARKVRSESEVNVDLLDGTFVRCRKEDMTLLVFEGRIPMPMLVAVQKMLDMPDATPVERVEALGAEHGRQLIDVLRTHACKVALDPIMVMEDDGNPDHLPISYLSTPQMMAIWQATALIPQVGQMAAADFRGAARHDVVDAPPDGGDVPRPSLVVAPRQVEQFIGR